LEADLLSAFPYTIEEVCAALFGIFLVILIIMPFYILGSLGLMIIARRHGLQNERLAWVPFARTYVLGAVAFDDKTAGMTFVGLQVLSLVFGSSKGRGRSITNGSYFVFKVAALHEIYKKMSDKAIFMTIATVLSLGLLGPIFLFVIRNNELLHVNERKMLHFEPKK